jgi:hypothetical protein
MNKGRSRTEQHLAISFWQHRNNEGRNGSKRDTFWDKCQKEFPYRKEQ